MLTQTQIPEYDRTGAIVVPDILSQDDVQRLRAVTGEFVERSGPRADHGGSIYENQKRLANRYFEAPVTAKSLQPAK